MNMAKMELVFDPLLIDLLSRGEKELLDSNKWDKRAFENRVYRVFDYFPELQRIPILIYFTHHRDFRYKALATMCPPRPLFTEDLIIDLDELRKDHPDSFIIIIYDPFYTLDETAQVLNYSHEFRHVSQFINNKKYYRLSRIICHLVGGFHEEELPTEVDAEITSKKILYKMYNPRDIDSWIDTQLENNPSVFYTRFKELNVDVGYDLEKEVSELWKLYRLDKQIKKLCDSKTRDKDQERILKIYTETMKS